MNVRKRCKRRLFRIAAAVLLVTFLFDGIDMLPWTNIHFLAPAVAEAATGTIDPNANGGLIQATAVSCDTASNFTCVDDGLRSPSTPANTTINYVTHNRNQVDRYAMTSLSGVDTVSSITVSMYHKEGATNFNFNVRLLDSSETVQYGTTQVMASSLTTTWSTVTFSGLSLTQSQLDGLVIETNCIRTGGGNATCENHAMYATATYTEVINATVSTTGSQQDLLVGTTSAHVGGSFAITENTGSRNVTGITITENGTVDASTELSNIKLFYEMDTSSPFNCVGMTYAGDGSETQFGSTDTDGFSAADGTSSFTGSVGITTTAAMCVYAVLDVVGTADAADTVEIQITNPTTDITFNTATIVTPATAIQLASTTVLRKTVLTQENYHWRFDDGSETTATSIMGAENTTNATMPKNATRRLRFAVSNEGNLTSPSTQFRFEYATATAACSALSTWVDVGATGGAFDMSDSANLTEGADTTDIATTTGGVSNPNSVFLTPNGGVRDVSSQTGSLTLTGSEFVELEYSLIATDDAVDGQSYCFRVSDAGSPLPVYTNYAEATVQADVNVFALGTQTSIVSVPTTSQYAGGVFALKDFTAGANTLSSVTITASGTLDIQNDLSNIKLRYDYDTTLPYECDDTSYANTDTQFGATVTNFNGSNQAVFSGSATISETQAICLYLEYDVESGAVGGSQLDISIDDPSSEVVISSSTVAPTLPVTIDGVSTFAAPIISQEHYHWRKNDGTETGATSATNGTQNTVLGDLAKNSTIRLRFAVANTGLASSSAQQFRLEWKQKVSTCSASSTWNRIDTVSDDWAMSVTGNLTDGANTTDVIIANGGVGDPAGTFLSSNGGVKDTNDTTAGVVVPPNNYLDLEYAIAATDQATQGATYCFRVTNAGTSLDAYTNYPEASIKLDTDYKIQRGVFTMTTDTHTLTAGSDYEAPTSSSRAFMRITNTQLTGAGPNTGNSNSNADDVTVYITNPSNITSNVVFARGTGATGNTRVAWEIIEYTGVDGGENEMIVRRQEGVSYGAANTTLSGTVTNTVVDNNDVAVFITGQRNLDAGRNAFNIGLSTAAWNTTNNQADFTRGGSGSVSDVSYALVEFTGSNWKVQRAEHTYAAAGSVETESITAVNSLTRTFVHVQKRTAQNNHADFGHEVWLSGIGQVSFLLDPAAGTPANHTSVAWIIENTQTVGNSMIVTRGNGTLSSARTGPETNNLTFAKTLDDLSITSLFVNNRSDETQRSWPEPILSARLISTTQYELWRSDTTANINYRTEIVEWPTAARKLTQNYYQLLEDNGLLTPTSTWPAEIGTLGENEEMTGADNPLALGDRVRIRMTLSVSASAMPAGLDSFDLQYAERAGTCSNPANVWHDVGGVGSSTAVWRGYDNPTPVDGTALSSGGLVISIATVPGTYEEENDSALNPFIAFPNDEVEYDWVVQHNGAKDKTSYCFRMIESTGAPLTDYNFYPVIRTVGFGPELLTWRWYDDETNPTPSTALAAENTAPINVANENIVKLRLTIQESSGASGNNNKFAVQYSEYADFSQAVATATASTSCTENSLWCYADGAGVDNDTIAATVISDADSCPAGCGTYNEGISTTTATFDQAALTTSEYEFTLKHAGARAGAVYYFRLFDVTTNEYVPLATASTYPSLLTEGAQLTFSADTVNAGDTIAGLEMDATSTAIAIDYGSLPFNDDYVIAQRFTVDTNATEGYQMFVFADQDLTNTYGDTIPPVTGTNSSPNPWNTACTGAVTGCFGYHTTDTTLSGGVIAGRFAPDDSYAALTTSPSEIMYSSVPTVDVHDVVYRIYVTEDQAAGDYTTTITYIVVQKF